MENTNDLCRRIERAIESQRGRRRLPVRNWFHDFLVRFDRGKSLPPTGMNAAELASERFKSRF
jgi:hypothetical protein